MLKTVPVRKLIIEMRFKPILSFYSKMDEIALEISSEFPDWERSPHSVELWNNENYHRIYFANTRMFYEADVADGLINEYFKNAVKYLKFVYEKFGYQKITRIGVRQWAIADLNKTFALMVDELGERYLNQSDKLNSILSDKVTDIAYAVNYETEDGWEYHLNLGPVTKNEWFQRVKYERNYYDAPKKKDKTTFKGYQKSIPENFLYIDIDSIAFNVDTSSAESQISAIRTRTHQIFSELVEYSKEKKG